MADGRHEILVVGLGMVGRGFIELFRKKKDSLGLGDVAITEAVDSRYGYFSSPMEIDTDYPRASASAPDSLDVIRDSSCDIVCEFTSADYEALGPGYNHLKSALSLGRNVITTNLGPVALHYDELVGMAERKDLAFRFKGTVMAGTPSFNMMDLVPGAGVLKFRAILNSTSNYILNEMAYGKSFAVSLQEARGRGIARENYQADINGLNSAAKCLIISKVLGWKHEFSDLRISGIENVTVADAKAGSRLVAMADRKSAAVQPTVLRGDDVLRSVTGARNGIEFETDTLGKIYSIGPGSGKLPEAQAALSDLLEII